MYIKPHPLGKFIRALRKDRKLKLADVGRGVGRSAAYICDVEKGVRGIRPNPIFLVKLADYFEVPVTTMLEKGGIVIDEDNENYKMYLKITRSKTRSELMNQRFTVLFELLDELETATVNIAPLRRLVEKTINAGRELQSAILHAR